MRSIDEQMNEIRRRKDIYAEAKSLRKKMIAESATGIACLALMISAAIFLPNINIVRDDAPILQYGSMIQSLPVIGYVLIALLAFATGVAMTLACIHWKEHKEKEREI
ncbi:MAG: hypothetical protein J5623_06415 [Clostridiales bacterium]|nr:hypothetical protein [Clostridiales bacterium]